MQESAATVRELLEKLEHCWGKSEDEVGGCLYSLQEILGARGEGNIGLAQINTTPGDLAGNAAKIVRYMAMAEALNLDLIAFPELALMGYPPRDVIGRHPFLVEENLRWLHALARRSGKTYVAVGFVEPRFGPSAESLAQGTSGRQIGKPYHNAAAILGEGRIQGIVRKSLLPEYSEFEDQRQFESAPPQEACYDIYGRKYGVSICEDLWNDPDFFDTPLYDRDPVAELVVQKPDVLLNLSSSPSRSRKEQMKHNLCAHVARKAKRPLVYVNQVGSVDEVGFDGSSRAYCPDGKLIARAKSFEEQLLVVNPSRFCPVAEEPPGATASDNATASWGLGWIEPLPLGLEKTLAVPANHDQPNIIQDTPMQTPKSFDVDDDSDLGRTYAVLCQGIRDYFSKNGFQRATLGLSGGLDSSVSVVLLADALGAENVLGISMPSSITPDENRQDARQIAQALGIQFTEVPISRVTRAFTEDIAASRQSIASCWGSVDARSNAADNIQAISRATILRQFGNEFRALPVATCDKSELYLGYATVNGDMSGALTPLGDVPKTKVRALAAWLNKNRTDRHGKPLPPALPAEVVTKPSGADLKRDPVTGKLVTAEEELMPYAFADEIIWRLETLQQSQTEMLASPFQYEQRFNVPTEQKAEWLEIFFNRMARAVFKWFIVPPILIVEGNGSIAKTDYHHPIVASRIRWQGHTDSDIASCLDAGATCQKALK